MNKDLPLTLRLTPRLRFAVFVLVLIGCTLIGALLMAIVMSDTPTTATMRISAVVQDVAMFIMPAVITAAVVSGNASRFLSLERQGAPTQYFIAFITLFVSMPAMEWLVSLNESLVLPDWLSGLEAAMRVAEERSREAVDLIIGGRSKGDLALSLIVVAVVAGLSEEVLFRGAIQRLIATAGVRRHVAVWITAFIFSAVHLQVYGLVPRMFLGAWFGYLLLWSGSLWVPITMHVANNAVVVTMMWLRMGGSESIPMSGITEFSAVQIVMSAVLTAVCLVVQQKHSTGVLTVKDRLS